MHAWLCSEQPAGAESETHAVLDSASGSQKRSLTKRVDTRQSAAASIRRSGELQPIRADQCADTVPAL